MEQQSHLSTELQTVAGLVYILPIFNICTNLLEEVISWYRVSYRENCVSPFWAGQKMWWIFYQGLDKLNRLRLNLSKMKESIIWPELLFPNRTVQFGGLF